MNISNAFIYFLFSLIYFCICNWQYFEDYSKFYLIMYSLLYYEFYILSLVVCIIDIYRYSNFIQTRLLNICFASWSPVLRCTFSRSCVLFYCKTVICVLQFKGYWLIYLFIFFIDWFEDRTTHFIFIKFWILTLPFYYGLFLISSLSIIFLCITCFCWFLAWLFTQQFIS